MSLLKKAVNQQAFLKAAVFGFAGSGKTYTATDLSIAIATFLEQKKPVAFFDTENGSDFMIPKFQAEGIELLVHKGAAFTDLLAVGREAEQSCCVLIVDSLTAVWRELMTAYQRRMKRTDLSFRDWGPIKDQWAEWTQFFLNSRLHIVALGRAGWDYDMEENDRGKKELIKVNTKMKAESEFGYEPSLVVEMAREPKGNEPGSGFVHVLHVLKDRTDTINGKAIRFEKPSKRYAKGGYKKTYEALKPVFDAMNIGGEHVALDTTRTSDALFDPATGENRNQQRARRAQIACEEVEGILTKLWPGQDAKSKQAKKEIVNSLFGTYSWTAVESKSVEVLEEAVRVLRLFDEQMQRVEEPPADLNAVTSLLVMCRDKLTDEVEQDGVRTADGKLVF